MSKTSTISGKAKAIAWLCTLVYFGSYLTRKNFNVMERFITNDIDSGTFAIIVSALTITYGIGQVVCGFLGDKLKPRHMLTGGLCLAAFSNIMMSIPVFSDITIIRMTLPWESSASEINIILTLLWAINGFAHSMLWPPIVRIMSQHMNDDEYGYAAVRVSWGSQFATILLYVGCPVLVAATNIPWRAVMIICAVLGVAIALVWMMTSKKLLQNPLVSVSERDKKNLKKIKGVPLPAFFIIPLILIFMGIILQGIMRDGIELWTPKFISVTFESTIAKLLNLKGEDSPATVADVVGTALTVVLAVFGIVFFSVYDFVHRKLLKNEVFCASAIFAVTTALAAILFGMYVTIGNSAPSIFRAVIMILLVAIIVANMHGINLMLITVVPKRFIKSGKVALFSGILNACTYIGSAVGFVAFEKLFDIGTKWLIASWIIVSALGCIVLLVATPIWKKFRREYSDNHDPEPIEATESSEVTEIVENTDAVEAEADNTAESTDESVTVGTASTEKGDGENA